MRLKSIKSNREYTEMVFWVAGLMSKNARLNSPTGQKIRIALKLIKQFEDLRFIVPFRS